MIPHGGLRRPKGRSPDFVSKGVDDLHNSRLPRNDSRRGSLNLKEHQWDRVPLRDRGPCYTKTIEESVGCHNYGVHEGTFEGRPFRGGISDKGP